MLLHIQFHNEWTPTPMSPMSLSPLCFTRFNSSPIPHGPHRPDKVLPVEPVHPMANATIELWRQADCDESNRTNTESNSLKVPLAIQNDPNKGICAPPICSATPRYPSDPSVVILQLASRCTSEPKMHSCHIVYSFSSVMQQTQQ